MSKDCEEKENDDNKDCVLKASKLHSPAKGCKSFMAPTISAASKFTPSPRKKVLVERNEQVRTSISFSDGKAMFFSNVSQDSEPRNENFLDSNLAGSENKKTVPKTKKVTFAEIASDSQHSVITDSDSWKVEKSKVVSSPIAPLDADPSLPPYDPKTNYLSPRPQFIRYKPNPRVEMLKEKALDSDELEGILMAEMLFSDSDEGAASADMVIGFDEEIAADAQASEPLSESSLPTSTAPVDEISVEEFVGSNGKKVRSLSRLMGFSVILVLLVACVSVSVMRAPSYDEFLSLPEVSALYDQSRAIVDSARLSLGHVAQRVHHVAAGSVSLVFKLANELVEGEKRAPLQFVNLTDLQEDAWKEAYFLKRVENVEEEEFEEELDTEMEEEAYADEDELDLEDEIDAFEEEEAYSEANCDDDHIEKGYDVVAAEETAPADSIEKGYDIVATEENAPVSVIQTEMDEETKVEAAMETSLDSANLESDIQMQMKEPNSVDESAAAASQIQETDQVEAAVEKISQGDINVGASDNADTITSDQASSNTESTPAKESFISVAIPCFIAGVVGVAALVVYKRNATSSSSNVVQVKPMLSKERDNGVTSSNTKKSSIQEEKEYSESWQTESQMSSSYHYQRSGANEVESSERKARKYTRRESLASSSESPSYGSFTTYERIPIKTNVSWINIYLSSFITWL